MNIIELEMDFLPKLGFAAVVFEIFSNKTKDGTLVDEREQLRSCSYKYANMSAGLDW